MERNELKNGTVLHFPGGQSFEILRVIGGGGHSLLYEARELGSELYVAVKEVFPVGGFVRKAGLVTPENADPERAAALEALKKAMELHETRLSQKASRRNHQVLFAQPPVWHRADIRLPDGTLLSGVENTYVRMESLREKGVPLAEYVRQARASGGLSLDTAIAVMETVLDAYAALHEDGFLHGDCQMGNLFLLRAGSGGEALGTACVIDFGSARELTENGLTAPITDDIFSTDGYCAPELLLRPAGEFRMSAACDVWSLGYLLLNLLTDRGLDELGRITQFLMTHPGEKQLTCEETAALCAAPAEADLLNRILKTALSNQPESRYPHAAAMREELLTLKRCRNLDHSKGISRHLLWSASWKHSQRNPSLFQTEHVPHLAAELPVKRLTIRGSLRGGNPESLGKLLREMESQEKNLYLHAAGGAGKSFATSALFLEYLETGDRVPLYLDLARYTEQALARSGSYDRVIPALLAAQYLGREDTAAAEQIASLLESDRCFLLLNNLHRVSPAALPSAMAALSSLENQYPGTWAIVAGRADDPGAEWKEATAERLPALHSEDAETKAIPRQMFMGGNFLEVLPIPAEDILELVKGIRGDVLTPEERVLLMDQKEALCLPMFLMRYLELAVSTGSAGKLPDSAMELLHGYFTQQEYQNNDRDVHDLLTEQLPWIGYQYELSGTAVHTRAEIAEWLDARYGWEQDQEMFFRQSTENLAVLDEDGDGTYRFTHDCYQEYFAALFAANCIGEVISRRSPEPLSTAVRIWPDELTAHCIDLCCMGRQGSSAVRVRTPAQVLNALYQTLSRLKVRGMAGADNAIYSIGMYEGLSGSWSTAMRWFSLNARNTLSSRLFYWMLRLLKMDTLGTSSPSLLRIMNVISDSGESEFQLGCLYEHGDGVRKSQKKALSYYQKAAKKGSAAGLYRCGLELAAKGDHKGAYSCYQQAADVYYPEAHNALGMALLTGKGVKKDPATSARHFRRAAESGLAIAQFNLANAYDNGEGLPQDYGEAAFWYRKAANQNEAEAQFCLGYFYEKGLGMEKDTAQALLWYRRAAEQEHTGATRNLARLCCDSKDPAEQALAVQLYRKLAEQGDVKGMNGLGYCLILGTGCSQNYAEALHWLQKAREAGGSASAISNLGCMYLRGYGMDAPDYEQAWALFQEAAAQDSKAAWFWLGTMWEDGLGRSADPQQALACYDKSAGLGRAGAAERADALRRQLSEKN